MQDGCRVRWCKPREQHIHCSLKKISISVQRCKPVCSSTRRALQRTDRSTAGSHPVTKQGRIGLRRDRQTGMLSLLLLVIAAVGSCPPSMPSTCVPRSMTTCGNRPVSSTNGTPVEGSAQTTPPVLDERWLDNSDITLCKPLPGIVHSVYRQPGPTLTTSDGDTTYT